MFRWVARHPAAVVPRTKETRYLMDPGYPLYNEKSNFLGGGVDGYSRLFPEYKAVEGVSVRLCMEATPDYMYQQTALSVLADLPTRPRIVFLLRNPVDRVLSLFGYAMNNVGSLDANLSAREFFVASREGVTTGDEVIDSAVTHSIYDRWVEQWIARVGRSRVDVYFFDDLVARPHAVMREFCRQMNMGSEFYESFSFKAENPTLQVRSLRLSRAKRAIELRMPELMRLDILKGLYRAINVRTKAPDPLNDIELIQEMREYFAEPNRQLAILLGRDLPAGWL